VKSRRTRFMRGPLLVVGCIDRTIRGFRSAGSSAALTKELNRARAKSQRLCGQISSAPAWSAGCPERSSGSGLVVFADEPGGLPLGMQGGDHAAQVQALRRGPSSGISFVLAPTSRWAVARPSRTRKADSRWTSLHWPEAFNVAVDQLESSALWWARCQPPSSRTVTADVAGRDIRPGRGQRGRVEAAAKCPDRARAGTPTWPPSWPTGWRRLPYNARRGQRGPPARGSGRRGAPGHRLVDEVSRGVAPIVAAIDTPRRPDRAVHCRGAEAGYPEAFDAVNRSMAAAEAL